MASPDRGRAKALSLAYRDLTELPRELLTRPEELQVLDLSHNQFSSVSDLRSLKSLSNISTLVLDDNEINSHVVFPPLPNLEVLWVNKNKISNLSVFIETVAANFPALKHLSMINNTAAPSYFNGGSLQQYEDYRHFVISYLPKLCFLDDTAVSPEERSRAEKVYGRRRLPQSKKEDKSRKSRKSSLPYHSDEHYP